MIKRVLITLIAVVLVASACALPVHAVDFGDYSDGWEQTGINNSVHNAVETFRILSNVLKGDVSVSEAASQIVGMGWTGSFNNFGAFVNELITTGDINVMSPREFVTAVGNALNNEISNNGGNVSNFPLVNGGYCQIGNFSFKPVSFSSGYDCIDAGFFPSFHANFTFLSTKSPCSGVVPYWPNGTPYKNTSAFYILGDVGTSNTLTIDNIDVSFEKAVYVFVTYTVRFTLNGSARSEKITDRIVFDYQDWGDNGDDLSYITDTPDLDNLNDDDLLKYIDNVINKLDETFPDLSTVEGLLQAILNQLNKLDTGGCDCSDVIAELNAAIITLATSSHSDNAQIIKLLQSIKDNVNNGGTTDLDPLLKKLDKIVDDLDYLKLINTIDLITDGLDKLSDTEKSYLNEYSKLIVTIGDKFGFTPLNNLINYLNSAFIFTSTPPNDLTFTYQGVQYVILSSSIFGNLQEPIKTARTFVSVLIIVSWAYSMRRKIIGGI